MIFKETTIEGLEKFLDKPDFDSLKKLIADIKKGKGQSEVRIWLKEEGDSEGDGFGLEDVLITFPKQKFKAGEEKTKISVSGKKIKKEQYKKFKLVQRKIFAIKN